VAVNLQGVMQLAVSPNSLAQAARQLRSLGGDITLNVKTSQSGGFGNVSNSIQQVTRQIDLANAALGNFSNTAAKLRLNANLTSDFNNLKSTAQAFGEKVGLAAQRFGAFILASESIRVVQNAFTSSIQSIIAFQTEMVKLSQTTRTSLSSVAAIGDEVTRISTTFGVSSKELLGVATVLAQAGLSATETKKALEALAKTTLTPSFENIKDTTEGLIAAMSQFKLEAKDFESVFGSINAVAAAFAVESRDLIDVIRKTGGIFKAISGDFAAPKEQLNQLLALFTSVRSTTRESADQIATGFRTIFARLERPGTVRALSDLGIQLTDLEGRFVGGFEAVSRLSQGLRGLESTDIRRASIFEELGGIRQLGRLIPLIDQFPVALRAYSVAQAGANSLTEDASRAQDSLVVKLAKLEERFLALARSIGSSPTFDLLARSAELLANNLLKVLEAAKPLLPLVAGLSAIKLGQVALGVFGGATTFAKGAAAKNLGGPIHKFAQGDRVPGVGNSDSVNAWMTPGEFVIKKDSTEQVDKRYPGFLEHLNTYGDIPNRNFATGGIVNDRTIKLALGKISRNPYGFDFRNAGNIYPVNSKDLVDLQVRSDAFGFYQPSKSRLTNFTERGIGLNTDTITSFEQLTSTLAHELGHRLDNLPNGIFNSNRLFTPERGIANNYKEFRTDYNRITSLQDRKYILGKPELFANAFSDFVTGKELPNTLNYPLSSYLKKRNLKQFAKGGLSKFEDSIRDPYGSILTGLDFIRKNQDSFKIAPERLTSIKSVIGGAEGLLNAPARASQQLAKRVSEAKGENSSLVASLLAKADTATQVAVLGAAIGTGNIAAKPLSYVPYASGIYNLASMIGSPRSFLTGAGKAIGEDLPNTVKAALAKMHSKKGFASGGTATDKVPAMLTPGEFIVSADKARSVGYDNLHDINQYGAGSKVFGYAQGGVAGISLRHYARGTPRLGVTPQENQDIIANLQDAISNQQETLRKAQADIELRTRSFQLAQQKITRVKSGFTPEEEIETQVKKETAAQLAADRQAESVRRAEENLRRQQRNLSISERNAQNFQARIAASPTGLRETRTANPLQREERRLINEQRRISARQRREEQAAFERRGSDFEFPTGAISLESLENRPSRTRILRDGTSIEEGPSVLRSQRAGSRRVLQERLGAEFLIAGGRNLEDLPDGGSNITDLRRQLRARNELIKERRDRIAQIRANQGPQVLNNQNVKFATNIAGTALFGASILGSQLPGLTESNRANIQGATTGGLLGGVLGRTAGGAIGGLFGPAGVPIGAAVGAFAGGLTGIIDGMLNASLELDKINRSNRIRNAVEKLDEQTKLFLERGVGAGAVRSSIGEITGNVAGIQRNQNAQRATIIGGTTQLASLAFSGFDSNTVNRQNLIEDNKEIVNNISGLQPIVTQLKFNLLNTTTSFEEFQRAQGGLGQEIIKALTTLEAARSNVSEGQARQVVEFRLREEAALIQRQTQLNRGLAQLRFEVDETYTRFNKIGESLNSFNISLTKSVDELDAFSESFEGKLRTGLLNFSESLRNPAQFGNGRNREDALGFLQNTIGGELGRAFSQNIRQQAQFEVTLRQAIEEAVRKGPGADDFVKRITDNPAIAALTQNNPALRQNLNFAVRGLGGGQEIDSKIIDEIKKNVGGSTQQILRELFGETRDLGAKVAEEFSRSFDNLTNIINKKNSSLAKALDLQLRNANIEVDIRKQRATLSAIQTGRSPLDFFGPAQADQGFREQIGVLTGRNNTSIPEIAARIRDATTERNDIQARLQAGSSPANQAANTLRLGQLANEVDRLQRALQLFGNSTERLTVLQEKFAQIQGEITERRGIAREILGGTGQDILDLNRRAASAAAVVQTAGIRGDGTATPGAAQRLFQLPDFIRTEGVRALLSTFGNTRVAGGGGLTGQQIVDALGGQLGQLLNTDLGQSTEQTQRDILSVQNQILAVLREQQQANNAIRQAVVQPQINLQADTFNQAVQEFARNVNVLAAQDRVQQAQNNLRGIGPVAEFIQGLPAAQRGAAFDLARNPNAAGRLGQINLGRIATERDSASLERIGINGIVFA
jgi:TP901 family phage tail tape measure protein